MKFVQKLDDPEPCRMRNVGGSECGTCDCQRPSDCLDPPLFTPVAMMLAMEIDHREAKQENK